MCCPDARINEDFADDILVDITIGGNNHMHILGDLNILLILNFTFDCHFNISQHLPV